MYKSNHPIVKHAHEFATLSLAGKKRYSGEDVVDHCARVAENLESFYITDPKTLAAAILHHSIQHGAATYSDLQKEFDADLAGMVKNIDSLRLLKLPEVTRKEFIESFRKMFLVLSKDMRVVLVKLADILDNLRTLDQVDPSKQKEVARETIEIFAPLAERLGIGKMKGQMQDLAFPFLYPHDYKRVKGLLKTNHDDLEKRLLKIKAKMKSVLDEEDISYRIEGRTKHLYSLYQKLKREEIDFDIEQIYDLIAFRIITDNEENCYKVLGAIHKTWKPMPGHFTDFIANPKPNGYRSIHTKVFGPNDEPFEIQMRTEQMHQEAEFGVAAHWHYAEVKSSGVTDATLKKGTFAAQDKLQWVQNLSQWQNEITDNEEFLKSVKTDLFGERIFVFTPKGDVKDLPAGATPVDFAYSIHSDLGHLAVGAKVNGKMVSMNQKLKNSDVCEIVISKDKKKKPNRDWLNFVVTSHAKAKIRRAFME